MANIARNNREITQTYEAAAKYIAEGKTAFSGMTYEEGIVTAIDWLIGDSDEDPMT